MNPVNKHKALKFTTGTKLIVLTEYKNSVRRASIASGVAGAKHKATTMDIEEKFVLEFREKFNSIESKVDNLTNRLGDLETTVSEGMAKMTSPKESNVKIHRETSL